MNVETENNNNNSRKQTTLEYLCEVGQLSSEEAESLLEQLQNINQGLPPQPILSEFTKASEVIQSAVSTEILLFFDTNLQIVQSRGASLQNVGLLTETPRSERIPDALDQKLRDKLVPLFNQSLQGSESESIYTFRDRQHRILISPRFENEKIEGGLAIIRDITGEAERQIQMSLLYKAVESANEMIVITDAKEEIGTEKILYVNRGFENATGYSRDEVLGKNPSLLQGPDTEPKVIRNLVENLSQGKQFEGETFNYRKDGSRFRLHWSITPVTDSSGKITHFISVQRDVTEQWEQKQRLEKMVADREMVLKEIHHRIKNNLAVVSGLLELQVLQNPSEKVQNALTQSMNRIKSIALLHETLYRSESFRDIELEPYFTDVAVEVTNTFLSSDKNISIETDIDPIRLTDLQAMPCGMIINEVVTNSCKHAFPDIQNCVIRIEVREIPDGKVLVRISDNGIGLPQDFDMLKYDALGMSLISALCNQLNAEFRFEDNNPGTAFVMSFKTQ